MTGTKGRVGERVNLGTEDECIILPCNRLFNIVRVPTKSQKNTYLFSRTKTSFTVPTNDPLTRTPLSLSLPLFFHQAASRSHERYFELFLLCVCDAYLLLCWLCLLFAFCFFFSVYLSRCINSANQQTSNIQQRTWRARSTHGGLMSSQIKGRN